MQVVTKYIHWAASQYSVPTVMPYILRRNALPGQASVTLSLVTAVQGV
jgi:hypothetical protein